MINLDFLNLFGERPAPAEFVGYRPPLANPELSAEYKLLINKAEFNLSIYGVNLNKVRFVFQPCFTYDLVDDEVSPKLNIMFPMLNNGLFDSTKEPVIIGEDKRSQRTMISLRVYGNPNWIDLSKTINESTRGFVFCLSDDYLLNSNRIRYCNLDEEKEKIDCDQFFKKDNALK